MSHTELRACLHNLHILPSARADTRHIRQSARFAKRWQHRCELLAKISWLSVYALTTKWMPTWFTKLDQAQLLSISLIGIFNWKITEWGLWYQEVADLLEAVLKDPTHQIWIQDQLEDYL